MQSPVITPVCLSKRASFVALPNCLPLQTERQDPHFHEPPNVFGLGSPPRYAVPRTSTIHSVTLR